MVTLLSQRKVKPKQAKYTVGQQVKYVVLNGLMAIVLLTLVARSGKYLFIFNARDAFIGMYHYSFPCLCL